MVGQQRILAGMASRAFVIGWDMGAGLAMARALGVNMLLAAEMLPIFEQIAVRSFNSGEGAQDYE